MTQPPAPGRGQGVSQVENTFLFCFTKASKACFRWGGVGWGPTCAGRLPHRPCQESPGRDHPQPRQGDEAGAGAGGRGAGRAGAWGPRQPRHRGPDPGGRAARQLLRLRGGREQPDRGAGANPEDGGGDRDEQGEPRHAGDGQPGLHGHHGGGGPRHRAGHRHRRQDAVRPGVSGEGVSVTYGYPISFEQF